MTDTTDESQLSGIGFVRLPNESYTEAEIVANPMLCWSNDFADVLDALTIEMKAKAFKKSQNPVLAIEAFVLSIDAGVYPPVSVLQWLADGFRTYHAGQGAKGNTLEKALGLTGIPGRDPHFKQLFIQMRNDMLFYDMDKLMYLGASREKAAELVANKLERADWNKSPWEMVDPDATTLADKHARAGHARLDEKTATLVGLCDKARVVNYLSTFSKDLLPPKLKKLV